jgi:hypothetical protein
MSFFRQFARLRNIAAAITVILTACFPMDIGAQTPTGMQPPLTSGKVERPHTIPKLHHAPPQKLKVGLKLACDVSSDPGGLKGGIVNPPSHTFLITNNTQVKLPAQTTYTVFQEGSQYAVPYQFSFYLDPGESFEFKGIGFQIGSTCTVFAFKP